jgi:hypothetical protein
MIAKLPSNTRKSLIATTVITVTPGWRTLAMTQPVSFVQNDLKNLG